MYSLGPEGRPTALTKFRRAFKQSINMSGLEGSVSDFVKSSILDPQPLNLDQVRQSVESYHNKEAAVLKIKAQINSLKDIDSLYKRARKAGERRAGYAWCAEEFRYSSIVEQTDALYNELQEQWERYQSVKILRQGDSHELAQSRKRLNELEVTLQSDDSVSQQERLKVQRSALAQGVERTCKQLGEVQQGIRRASDIVKFRGHLPAGMASQLDELVRLADGEPPGWPTQPVVIDKAVRATTETLPGLMAQTDEARSALGADAIQLRKELADDQARLERLEQGGADLNHSTLRLVEELAAVGIQAIPVCELVEVTDQHWQPAIEAYLRGNAQALIVPPHQAQQAVEIYRQLKKGKVYGATVVNTERAQHWHDEPVPGTAAALIEGTNAEAVAYLRRLLRGIRLIQETHDFMQQERALTPDGMFIRQAGIQRLALPEMPILGRQARQLQIQRLQARIAEQLPHLVDLNQQLAELRALYDGVSDLRLRLGNIPNLELLVSNLNADQREINELTRQIEAIDTSHVDALKDQLKDTRNRVKRLEKQVNRHFTELGGLRKSFKIKNQQRHKFDRLLPELQKMRQSLEQDEDYSAERASALYEALENEHDLTDPEQYAVVISKATSRADSAAKEQRTDEGNAQERLGTYLANYPTDGFWRDTQTKAGIRTEVDHALHQLIDIGLHEREKDVKEALYKVQRVIRSDLAIRLRSHINTMRLRLSELNQELRERPFSANQKYEFIYNRLGEYSELLQFIESADQESIANVNSMFDEFEHLNDWIETMVKDDQGDRLADYRNYFHFDIAIKDEQAGITEKLSRKIGSASGGEHKTPFYVAMGASLASAYRLERLPDGKIHGGASLYLADEAFEKMDRTNTLQAAGYLQSIGLQLFVAAPDDAEPRLREVVDTVMFFIREGSVATIEVDYVKPKARELLAQFSSGQAERTVA